MEMSGLFSSKRERVYQRNITSLSRNVALVTHDLQTTLNSSKWRISLVFPIKKLSAAMSADYPE